MRRIDRVAHAVLRGPLVERVQQPVLLEVGELAQIAQRSGELGLAVPNAGQPAHELHPERRERVQVDVPAVGIAGDLERGKGAGAPQVLDLVVALVVQARRVHPPLDVPAAVRPGRAHVLAHRQRHGTSGAMDLVGDLRAGGGRADDHHAARLEALRVAVLGGGQLGNAGRHRFRELRDLRDVERAGGKHDRLAMPGALPGDDLVAVGRAPHGSDRAVRLQGRRRPRFA